MSREWKPGDVAMIPFSRGEVRAIYRPDGWIVCDTLATDGCTAFTDVRPLVVIDPEDREQMARVESAIAEACGWTRLVDDRRVDAFQQAFRELANPKPPKPDEPMGLWSVVRDGRHTYVRTDTTASYPWEPVGAIEPPHTERRSWIEFSDAVQVLSKNGGA